jgi:hypothetical protein
MHLNDGIPWQASPSINSNFYCTHGPQEIHKLGLTESIYSLS